MLIHKLDPFAQLDIQHESSRAIENIRRLETSCSYNIYSDGVLHEVITGQEGDARKRVLALSNLHPDVDWSFD